MTKFATRKTIQFELVFENYGSTLHFIYPNSDILTLSNITFKAQKVGNGKQEEIIKIMY